MNDKHVPLLEVDRLAVEFDTPQGPVSPVDGLSLRVEAGETLGIVGESGCGKSVTALAIMGLIAGPTARVRSGAIRYRGTNLLALPPARMRQIRGDRIAMVFQDPMTSLNPVLTVGEQIAETVMLHQRVGRRAAMQRALEMLRLVQIAEPERRLKAYPHEMSGGMRQRVMLALALACEPEVLIADEPTTALDVTIQAQILGLLKDLQRRMGMAVIMITHDLGVVAECCDRVAVMYAGRKVEEAPVAELFERPMHPYTRALMASMPAANTRAARLPEIPGMVPMPGQAGPGCAFAERCARAVAACHAQRPLARACGEGHEAACSQLDTMAAARRETEGAMA